MLNLQNDLEEFEETDFPAFPVVFQQELEEVDLNPNMSKAPPKNNKVPFKLP